jgi:hypothetical protein
MYIPSPSEGPLRQGEILSEVNQIRLDLNSLNPYENPIVRLSQYKYGIVITQDCDLDLDDKARRGETPSHGKIENILVCEAVPADEAKAVPGVNARLWDFMTTNQHLRYHFLPGVSREIDLSREGIPDLAFDFKRYVTIPRDELYFCIGNGQTKRRARLESVYMLNFMTRFYHFQSRVPLP